MFFSWSILPLVLSIAVTNVHTAPHQKRIDHESENEAADAIKLLSKGHQAFMKAIDPELLRNLTDDGQHPGSAILGCSDSRASESAVFAAPPGTLFTSRNIANVYSKADTSVESFLAYGVNNIGVKNIIVMGHYGCGGVGSAIVEGSKKLDAPDTAVPVSVADAAVRAWIEPIIELYQSSNREVCRHELRYYLLMNNFPQRKEIVQMREQNAKLGEVKIPVHNDTGFRALVEENVLRSARSIYSDPIIQNHFVRLHAHDSAKGTEQTAQSEHEVKLVPVFIHSWVYDILSGSVTVLGKPFGPTGYSIPGEIVISSIISSDNHIFTDTDLNTLTINKIEPDLH